MFDIPNAELRGAYYDETQGITATLRNDEIEALRAQVANSVDTHIHMRYWEGVAEQRKEECEALREQVAELTKENSEQRIFMAVIGKGTDYVLCLKEQLAAMTRLWENEYRLRCEAQARIVELREAIEEGLSTYHVPLTARIAEALTAPDNTEALDRRLREERERCIEQIDPRYDGLIAAIRRLK